MVREYGLERWRVNLGVGLLIRLLPSRVGFAERDASRPAFGGSSLVSRTRHTCVGGAPLGPRRSVRPLRPSRPKKRAPPPARSGIIPSRGAVPVQSLRVEAAGSGAGSHGVAQPRELSGAKDGERSESGRASEARTLCTSLRPNFVWNSYTVHDNARADYTLCR